MKPSNRENVNNSGENFQYSLSDLLVAWELNTPHLSQTNERNGVPKRLYMETFKTFHMFTLSYFPHTKISTIVEFFQHLNEAGMNKKQNPEMKGFFPFTLTSPLDMNEGVIGREISLLKRVQKNLTPPNTENLNNIRGDEKGKPNATLSGGGEKPVEGGESGDDKGRMRAAKLVDKLSRSNHFFSTFPLGFAKNYLTPPNRLLELMEHEEDLVRTAAFTSIQILNQTVDTTTLITAETLNLNNPNGSTR